MFAFDVFPTYAQTLPSSADSSRIEPLKKSVILDRLPARISIPKMDSNTDIPDAAKKVTFTLKQIKFEGMTAFEEKELIKIYQPYISKKVLLSSLWTIADKITQYYQNKGYFLSRAYVPEQEIDSGTVIIKVVEGFISEVNINDEALEKHALIRQLIERIKAKKPLNAYELESFILQMNALPGEEFSAFVEPIEGKEDGFVRLLLRPQKEAGRGSVSFNNFGSRFLGPYQATAIYQDSFLPLQETTVSVLTSTPTDELKYVALRHGIPIYPDWKLELSGDYVTAQPGDSLKSNNIQSNSIELGFGIHWQPIRQRQENLIASLEFSGKNTNGDILNNNPLTRDRIRTVKGQLSYDTNDNWDGYNYSTIGLVQGLKVFGISKEGERHLSRAEAVPDFTTAQFNYTRQQPIDNSVMVVGQVSGQLASGPLFSAEEFGYGGQTFGLAYDPSEITGDHGLAASLEVRYLSIASWQKISFVPYTFYDIGKVWNEDTGGINESGSSTGLGMRLKHSSGLSGNLGLAWPLTRDISTPIHGNGKNPRLLFQVVYGF